MKRYNLWVICFYLVGVLLLTTLTAEPSFSAEQPAPEQVKSLSEAEKELILMLSHLKSGTQCIETIYQKPTDKVAVQAVFVTEVLPLCLMYGTMPEDANALLEHVNKGTPLPERYRAPTLPDANRKKEFLEKLYQTLLDLVRGDVAVRR